MKHIIRTCDICGCEIEHNCYNGNGQRFEFDESGELKPPRTKVKERDRLRFPKTEVVIDLCAGCAAKGHFE